MKTRSANTTKSTGQQKNNTTSGSTSEHQRLVHSVLLSLGSHPQIRLWKQTTGRALIGSRFISFGLKGSADLSGIVSGGVRLEIECKTGEATQSKEQLAFESMINRMGGIYILARSVEQAYDQLQEICSKRGIQLRE